MTHSSDRVPHCFGAHRHHHHSGPGLRRKTPAQQHVLVPEQIGEVGAWRGSSPRGPARRAPRSRCRPGAGSCGPPSAPITYCARTLYSRPPSRSRISSARRRPRPGSARSARDRSGSRPGESSSARSRRIGSRRIWGRFICRDRARRRPVLIGSPPAPQHSTRRIRAAVALASGDAGVEGGRGHRLGAACCAARSPAPLPTSCMISIARMFSTCALGSREVVGSALTSSVSTPRPASSIDAVRPGAAAADDQNRHLLVEGAVAA